LVDLAVGGFDLAPKAVFRSGLFAADLNKDPDPFPALNC
jgi:hypothetical protein